MKRIGKQEGARLRLVEAVCRDCGRGAVDVALSPFLDFQLCKACIDARERALRSGPPVRPLPRGPRLRPKRGRR